jgi:hypothetical protein
MHSIRRSNSLIRLLTSTTSILVAGCILFLATFAAAQDSPGRFEAGTAFSTLRMPGIAGLGPALEGDVNFGRYISLDGSLSWFPTRPGGQSAATGFFGAKIGKRTERFGFFGKARPAEKPPFLLPRLTGSAVSVPFPLSVLPGSRNVRSMLAASRNTTLRAIGSSAGTLAICSCFQTSLQHSPLLA